MTGLGKLDPKQRRAERRRNHIARDLRTPKYRQRIVEIKNDEDEYERKYRKYGYIEDED